MPKVDDRLDFEGYRLPAETKLVNCASCRCLLLGRSMQKWLFRLSMARREELPPLVAGHINHRPYCDACLQPTKTKMDLGGGERLGKDMTGPCEDNGSSKGVREWEEGEQ